VQKTVGGLEEIQHLARQNGEIKSKEDLDGFLAARVNQLQTALAQTQQAEAEAHDRKIMLAGALDDLNYMRQWAE